MAKAIVPHNTTIAIHSCYYSTQTTWQLEAA